MQCVSAFAEEPQRQAAVEVTESKKYVRIERRNDESRLGRVGLQGSNNRFFSAGCLQFDVKISAMAELRERVFQGRKTIPAPINQVGVVGSGDQPAAVIGIVPDHIRTIEGSANVKFEAVTSLRQCNFESRQ
jgi:hypothetical protein